MFIVRPILKKIKMVYTFVYMDRFVFINIRNMWKETYQSINNHYIIRSEKWEQERLSISMLLFCLTW